MTTQLKNEGMTEFSNHIDSLVMAVQSYLSATLLLLPFGSFAQEKTNKGETNFYDLSLVL